MLVNLSRTISAQQHFLIAVNILRFHGEQLACQVVRACRTSRSVQFWPEVWAARIGVGSPHRMFFLIVLSIARPERRALSTARNGSFSRLAL